MDNTIFDSAGARISIERLDAVRVSDLETLHTAVYGRPPERGLYKKKYDTEYTGHSWLGYIAYTPEGVAAAYYGVLPCLISWEGRSIPAAQSVDTMTHPLHRGKGLFVLLAGRTYQLCRVEGIQLLFGFPNQNSYSTFVNRLGWKDIGQMDLFVLPVQVSLLRKLLRSFHQLNIHPQQGLPNQLLQEGFAGVLRDEGYLNYKTYNSTTVVAVDGGRVWIRAGVSLFVGDVEIEEDQFDNALKVLETAARGLGIPDVSFQVSKGARLHRLLAERFQPRPSFPVIVMDLGAGIPLEQLKFTFADIDIF